MAISQRWLMQTQVSKQQDRGDVAVRLREFIATGRFVPNERLVEADLATVLQANRANVRIALAMLDQEGLVIRERNRGAFQILSMREPCRLWNVSIASRNYSAQA